MVDKIMFAAPSMIHIPSYNPREKKNIYRHIMLQCLTEYYALERCGLTDFSLIFVAKFGS